MRSLISALIVCLILSTGAFADDALLSGFKNPPVDAKPQTWWHWMNGNVTREGITADLEAMHRVGIQEANIITVASDIPPGPVQVMSPQFFDMVEFATHEANRLGMTLCMDNCPGWSSSGGPWVKPENAMQKVVTSEKQITGPMKFNEVLAQPPTNLNFFRDVTVLAFRTPKAEVSPALSTLSPKITSSMPDLDGSKIIDRDMKTTVSIPSPTTDTPQFILLDFPQAVSARSIVLTAGENCPACGGRVDVSVNGTDYQQSHTFSIPNHSTMPLTVSLGTDAVTAKFFRIHFTRATKNAAPIVMADVDLNSKTVLSNLDRKAIFSADEIDPKKVEADEARIASPDEIVSRDSIVNLTANLKPDGTLTWDVPEGNWTILRVGYTPTGVTNHPAPPEATGLECDKLAKEGLDASWNGMMQPLLDRLGPLAGKTMIDCLIDSYETGGQNWTPKMVEEFKSHRGYDPTPFLLTLTGRIIDSPMVTERFLWDWRRTISDLFAENYFDYFAELCHKHGLKSLVEPYTGPFESLICGRAADVPMGEFWAGSQSQESVKLASSVGHIYGQRVIGAESFTGAPDHGRWTDDPYSLKPLGDLAFCQGINRYIFHRFTHQPWMNRFPGMTMGQWGINLDRTNTWFEEAKPWLDYVTRSQYLLQQGRFVADFAYFCGESAPVVTRIGDPALPRGYDYDSINADVLLKSSVTNGRLSLPDGESYAVLVLPPNDVSITPQLLTKFSEFVNDGLTIVGKRPTHSPSLRDYPQCDQTVADVADKMWADVDGKQTTEHAIGKGRIVDGKPLVEVMNELKIPEDFSTDANRGKTAPILYIHRALEDGDCYFVANHANAFKSINCTFRVNGKVPELWHPDTGQIETAPVYEETDGRTTLPLQLDPFGSVFVIFRQSSAGKTHLTRATRETAAVAKLATSVVIKKATYGSLDGGGSADVTAKLAAMVKDGELSVVATNDAMGGDPAMMQVKHLVVDAVVNGVDQNFTVPENEVLNLPDTGVSGAFPAFELRAAASGAVELLSRKPGHYEFTDAAGKTTTLNVETGANVTPVDGSWELKFPPNWGAPASVSLDKLISWPEHTDTGVKYFSGTATYAKTLNIPADSLGKDKIVWLDLGKVKNFAQVNLNGKDLGIQWKPPFRFDITTAVHTGENDLQIKVTNLWPNRIIGDEQLDPDVQWVGMRPAKWPQWLLDGGASPSGRFTFTTWHHWNKTGKLLDSGLIGPVNVSVESGRWIMLP